LGRLNFSAFFAGTGRIQRLQLPSGTIQFDFDPATRVTTMVDRKNLVSRYFQNEDGITVRVINPMNEETAIGLDAVRNVTSLSRNGTIVESMEYDSQHRITLRRTASDAGTIERRYTYDPATGLLGAIHSSNGEDQSFAYDQNGNLTSAVLPDGEHKFKFSAVGDLLSISENGETVSFAPHPDGFFASMKNPRNGVTEFRYKPGNQLQEVTFPGGVKSTFNYQPTGLRSSITLSSGGRSEYNYDLAGNLTESKVFDKKGKQLNGQKRRWILRISLPAGPCSMAR
jgi:YD repeat-containing protein